LHTCLSALPAAPAIPPTALLLLSLTEMFHGLAHMHVLTGLFKSTPHKMIRLYFIFDLVCPLLAWYIHRQVTYIVLFNMIIHINQSFFWNSYLSVAFVRMAAFTATKNDYPLALFIFYWLGAIADMSAHFIHSFLLWPAAVETFIFIFAIMAVATRLIIPRFIYFSSKIIPGLFEISSNKSK